jgi:hypothetical protein
MREKKGGYKTGYDVSTVAILKDEEIRKWIGNKIQNLDAKQDL